MPLLPQGPPGPELCPAAVSPWCPAICDSPSASSLGDWCSGDTDELLCEACLCLVYLLFAQDWDLLVNFGQEAPVAQTLLRELYRELSVSILLVMLASVAWVRLWPLGRSTGKCWPLLSREGHEGCANPFLTLSRGVLAPGVLCPGHPRSATAVLLRCLLPIMLLTGAPQTAEAVASHSLIDYLWTSGQTPG